ncbi:peptidase family S49-domain-containing protein [Pavlovales sp. CCMP2436]|nr:peptidase family S49-domain-containing protein [Pavlovales sp. CCMP2436]
MHAATSHVAGEAAGRAPPARVYVLSFDGDIQASQVSSLREEVTAVLREASAGDEVVLKLNTGGGTVTGYGLAASQLERVKLANLTLTICVEQVAASGGYMMACVASPGRLFASPFAVLGSIGVISEQPNVFRRLKKEGIVFLTVTAGKFKRTLTPFKKPSQKDFDKQVEEIEQILTLFKSFVARNRPKLDIDKVATGETWFGPDALALNLVDALLTSDEVILAHAKHAGTRVYNVRYDPRQARSAIASLLGDEGDASAEARGGGRGLLEMAARGLARAVASELRVAAEGELGSLGGGALLDAAGGRAGAPSARYYTDQILAKAEGTTMELR